LFALRLRRDTAGGGAPVRIGSVSAQRGLALERGRPSSASFGGTVNGAGFEGGNKFRPESLSMFASMHGTEGFERVPKKRGAVFGEEQAKGRLSQNIFARVRL
jgi:hypothetical protein